MGFQILLSSLLVIIAGLVVTKEFGTNVWYNHCAVVVTAVDACVVIVVKKVVVEGVGGVVGGVVQGSSLAHGSMGSGCGLYHGIGVVVMVFLIFLTNVDAGVLAKRWGG